MRLARSMRRAFIYEVPYLNILADDLAEQRSDAPMYKDRDTTHHEMSARPTATPSYRRPGAMRLLAVVLCVVLLTAFGGADAKAGYFINSLADSPLATFLFGDVNNHTGS